MFHGNFMGLEFHGIFMAFSIIHHGSFFMGLYWGVSWHNNYYDSNRSLSWAKFSWIFMQLAIQFHEISYHDYFHGVITMGISWEICLLVNLVIMLL